ESIRKVSRTARPSLGGPSACPAQQLGWQVPVTPEPSSQQRRSPTQAELPSWQPHPSSPQAPADAPGSLQLPAPSQNPEQQASQPSLQLQVLPQFWPSGMQVLTGSSSQMPLSLQ